MPPPGKPVYLRGGKSTPSYSPSHKDSVFNYASSSFLSSENFDCDEARSGLYSTRNEDSAGHQWNPRHSMAFNSAKGLLNPVGENNCFLNCAVQVSRHHDINDNDNVDDNNDEDDDVVRNGDGIYKFKIRG